ARSRLVAPDHTDGNRDRAERAQVGRRVGAASRDRFGLRVLEDQDRRLARDARDVAVDELVRDEIGEDGDAASLEAAHDGEQALRVVPAHAGATSCARIHVTASKRSSATCAGFTVQEGDWYSSSPRPYPVRTRTVVAPARWPASMSRTLSPIMYERS